MPLFLKCCLHKYHSATNARMSDVSATIAISMEFIGNFVNQCHPHTMEQRAHFERLLALGNYESAKSLLMKNPPDACTFADVANYGAGLQDETFFREFVTKVHLKRTDPIASVMSYLSLPSREGFINVQHWIIESGREDVNTLLVSIDALSRMCNIRAHIHLEWDTFRMITFSNLMLHCSYVIVNAEDVQQNNTHLADVVQLQTANPNILINFGSSNDIIEGERTVALTDCRTPYMIHVCAFDNVYNIVNPSYTDHMQDSMYQQIDAVYSRAVDGATGTVHIVLTSKVFKKSIVDLYKSIKIGIPLMIGLQAMKSSGSCFGCGQVNR